MKQRIVKNRLELERAALDLVAIDQFPLVMTVTLGSKLRSAAANAKYWTDVEYFQIELNQTIDQIADKTGYTPLEVKRLLADEMQPEYAAILFVRSKEAIHEILKLICNVPTSTKLGTKEFAKFNDMLAQVMSDVIGQVKAMAGKV